MHRRPGKSQPEVESSEQTLEDLAPLEPQNKPTASTLSGRVLQPYQQLLTTRDVHQCVVIENECFPPHERASKDKIFYRLTKCSGLCWGIFTTVQPDDLDKNDTPTMAVAPVVETGHDRQQVMLGQIIATMTTNSVIRDEDMELPPDWESRNPAPSNLGHKANGRTVAIHSFAVLPSYQGKGVGRNLMTASIKRWKDSGIADRIALLAEDELVRLYEMFGFVNKGKSQATFGGIPWNDMVYDFTSDSGLDEYLDA